MGSVVPSHRPVSVLDCPDEDEWWRAETDRRALRRLWLESGDPEEQEAKKAADRVMCSRSFLFWAQHYGVMYNPRAEDPARRRIPFVAWPKQLEFLDWLEERTRLGELALVPKSREVGVSWMCLMRLWWAWRFEPGFSALLGSRKEDLVDKAGDSDSLFQKLRWMMGLQPDHLKPASDQVRSTHMLLEHQTIDSTLVGEATNPAFGQGKRRRVIFIDEAARVQNSVFASTWLAIESAWHSLWVVYNPGAKDHKTYDLHHGAGAVAKKLIFPITWEADPRRDEDWKRRKLKEGGGVLSPHEFKSSYECQYGYILTGKIWDVRKDDVEYHEEHPDWQSKSAAVRSKAWQLAGWDFGSGPSLLCAVFGLLEPRERPVLWIDAELTWRQTQWKTAAADARHVMGQYGGRAMHFGDPAGKQRESDQKSWEVNLRSGGIPLWGLPDWYNKRDGEEWIIRLVQTMLDEGRIRIHRRCRYLWEVLETWQRDVPAGFEIDFLSRAYIPPKHDMYSHGGHALMYLAAGASLILEHEHRALPIPRPVESVAGSPAAQISTALRGR